MRVSSGSPLEPEIGFSRAVRVGNHVFVSGTAPIGPDGISLSTNDVYEQTMRCLEIVCAAIEAAGGKMADVVRTRVMLTDISTWREAARAHGVMLGEARPATTFVQVSGFIDPAWRVEIEADCIVSG